MNQEIFVKIQSVEIIYVLLTLYRVLSNNGSHDEVHPLHPRALESLFPRLRSAPENIRTNLWENKR